MFWTRTYSIAQGGMEGTLYSRLASNPTLFILPQTLECFSYTRESPYLPCRSLCSCVQILILLLP
ncbi:rCG58218 [Rattus norvegicus]|uniref:RCG58218 n=1 Tax=Rattus norvegicus TaxID=10116 RepID=A6J4B6_RAT|nr:rCG58218 [Rattus norvegicus]